VGGNYSTPNGWEIVGSIILSVAVDINGEPAQVIFFKANGALGAWSKLFAKKPFFGGGESKAKKCENAYTGRGNATWLD
jgi:hypothetical protein